MEFQDKQISTKQRQRRPKHPGRILEKEFLEPLEISQTELAESIDCDRKTINRLVNGQTSLSVKLAQKLRTAFGMTPKYWLHLQQAVDLYEARQEAEDLSDEPSIELDSSQKNTASKMRTSTPKT